MNQETLSPAEIKRIRLEYMRLRADEDVLHNRDLHRRILETWRRDSPKMWARLSQLKLAEPLAYVLQERMWQAMNENLRAGLPVTDAREQAEIDHLMLEPEEVLQPNPRMSPEAEAAMMPREFYKR